MEYSQVTVPSTDDAIKLVATLRGLRLENSNLGLRFYWPVELKFRECGCLNKMVEAQMQELHRKANGCYYDKEIENK